MIFFNNLHTLKKKVGNKTLFYFRIYISLKKNFKKKEKIL